MKTKYNLLVLIFMFLVALPFVLSQPVQFPHEFYGDVLINGQPAPDGTLVEGRITGKTVSTNIQNPVETVSGNYGKDGLPLLVQGSDLEGEVRFYVNGVYSGETYTFAYGGGPTEVDLSIPAQANGKICSVNAHCSSNRCVSGVCTAQTTTTPGSGGSSGGTSGGSSGGIVTTTTTTVKPSAGAQALVIIDTIRSYYEGSSELTPFDILDMIRNYYGGN